VLVEPECHQALLAEIRLDDYIASSTTVATVGTALRNKFLTSETATAVATASTFNINFGHIDKHKKLQYKALSAIDFNLINNGTTIRGCALLQSVRSIRMQACKKQVVSYFI
jgi:hypothetical protein